MPYLPGLDQKLQGIFRDHKIRCFFEPSRKIGQILPSPKDGVDYTEKQGVVYQVPSLSCNLSYVERSPYLKVPAPKQPCLKVLICTMDWDNSKILANENNWHKHKFIESFYINSKSNTINARNTVKFPEIYQNMFNEE